MKRILTIAISVLFTCMTAFAARQSESIIKGTVLDKASGEPVGWATVALMSADSTIVAGGATDEKGLYQLKTVAGSYTLTVSLIGYKDYSCAVTLAPGTNEPEPVLLELDAQMLAGASVTERVKLIERKIDKVVMNVRESAFAEGSNALELIKKAPGVTIDKDGNVKLNGKAVSVWIDGRPSNLDGKSLESLLRSTNGESIDQFELMEHPSAKYDAAGQGGIINIKTKRNHMQGFNGSLGLGGGGMYYNEIGSNPWQQSGWLNLAYRTAKTNTFLNLSEEFYNMPMLVVNDMTSQPADFRQVSTTTHVGFFSEYNVKLGTDWFINDRNTLGFIAFVPGEYSTFNSLSSDMLQYVGGVKTQEATASINNGPSRAQRLNLNLNYTHVFDPQRASELTANVDYYHNVEKDFNSQSDTTVAMAAPDVKIFSRTTMDAANLYDIYSAKADWQSVVWKKFMLESGAKWALSRTDNNSIEQQVSTIPENNITRKQDFLYSENIAAAYVSLAGQIGPKVSFKAGLRGEYTNSFGDWRTSGTQTSRDYFDLFPTAFVGFQASEKWNFNASYTRRIDRPRYSQLNPTKTFIDARTYTLGKPDLLPQYTNSVSTGASYGQHLSLTLAYNGTKNVVEQMPSFDSNGTQYLTWDNVGRQQIGYASFSVSALPIGKWLQWTLFASEMYLNTFSEATNLTSDCWSTQMYTDFTFLLPKDWKVDLDGYYGGPMAWGYFRIHPHWSTNIAVKKNLLDNRLTLTFKFEDIFRSSRSDLDIIDPMNSGTVAAFQQKYYNQKLIFDITWNFGRAQKPMRQRRVGNLEEMSRVGGSSGIGK